MPAKVFRLLIIEEHPENIETFRAWLPTPSPLVGPGAFIRSGHGPDPVRRPWP